VTSRRVSSSPGSILIEQKVEQLRIRSEIGAPKKLKSPRQIDQSLPFSSIKIRESFITRNARRSYEQPNGATTNPRLHRDGRVWLLQFIGNRWWNHNGGMQFRKELNLANQNKVVQG
jgi:hypothetical protein